MTTTEITSAFGSSENPQLSSVAKSDVQKWASCTDLEVLGLLYRYTASTRFSKCVTPELTREEFLAIAKPYLRKCLEDDPQGTHTHSRYEAGWEIASLFTGLWRESGSSRQQCVELRQWLEGIIEGGNSEVQLCLVNATLEHLFEDKGIAKFFEGWSTKPHLARIYADAMLWPEQGGASPLGEGV
jgi:hypothetical protein